MNGFTVVYAEERGGFLKRCAEKLCRAAKEIKGLDLCAVSDTEAPVEHEILIGNTNRAETAKFKEGVTLGPLEYRMGLESGKYVIVGDGLMSVSYGVDRFISEFLSEEGREMSGEVITESKFDGCVERPEGTDLRIITANLMFEKWARISYGEEGFMPNYVRAEAFRIMLDAYKPDVLGLQECSPDWHGILADTVESKDWGFVAPGKVDDSNGETILCYNKNTVTFVNGGHISYPEFAQTSRICSGLFQLKDGTGRKFLFYTTHWSWNRPEIADMEMRFYSDTVNRMRAENGGIPAFCTADFNTGYRSERYLGFVERADLADTFDIAKENGATVNEIFAFGRPGDDSRGSAPYAEGVDHIFGPKDMRVYRHETLLKNRMVDMSDHTPRCADVAWDK
ncbi:MAG: hypothetical protein IJ011_01945 [Clostridia bacterium]|nr:hypothetical protein [Clostridia bacterium]